MIFLFKFSQIILIFNEALNGLQSPTALKPWHTKDSLYRILRQKTEIEC